MRKVSITTELKLITQECCNCGIIFAMPERLNDKYRASGGIFYCPNGHGQGYIETEVTKLRHKLDQREGELERTHQRLDGALKDITTKKRQITRMKNRSNAGVCLECHRHFENLQRHMETKHQ